MASKKILPRKPARAKKLPAAPRRICGAVDRHRFVVLWSEIAAFINLAHDALNEVCDATRDKPHHPDREWLDMAAIDDALLYLDQLGNRMAEMPVVDIEGILRSPVDWITTADTKGGK